MDRASRCGSGTVEKLTTSLRAFLRYLAVQGCCRVGLDTVVPAYANWRLADMPRYLAAEQVNRLIAACDGKATAFDGAVHLARMVASCCGSTGLEM